MNNYPSYQPTARAACVITGEKISGRAAVPVWLSTTTKDKPRYALVDALRNTYSAPAVASGPIYDNLTYRFRLEVDASVDSDALAAALLNTAAQKNPWARVEGGYAVNLNNLKSHRVLETLAERCKVGKLEAVVYYNGAPVETVRVEWANRSQAGRWLAKDKRANAKRCEFLQLVDAATAPYKGYTNYPEN